MVLFKFAIKNRWEEGGLSTHPGYDVYEIATIEFIDAFNINERAVANIKKLS